MTPNEAQRVWDMAYRFWPAGSVFRYFARKPTSKGGTVFGSALGTPAGLAQATDWADRNGYNSYWQPNPTTKRHGTRCSTADISHIVWFMVDIDPVGEKQGVEGKQEVLEFASYVETRLEEWFGVPDGSALWIHSGRGVQLLYPFYPALPDSFLMLGAPPREIEFHVAAPTAFRYWLQELQANLGPESYRLGCKIDTDCSDLPRLMRMPYTVNQKTEERAYMDETGVSPDMGFLTSLITRVPPSTWTPRKPTTPLGAGQHWVEYTRNMTVTGRRFLQEGSTSPGRHHGATAAMLSLIELGADEDAVRGALYFGAALCEPPLSRRDVDDMVRRRFQSVARQRLTKFDNLVDAGPDLC